MSARSRPFEGSIVASAASGVMAVCLAACWGCGGDSADRPSPVARQSAVGADATAHSEETRAALPVAAISSEPPAQDDPVPPPEKGTPEWMLREIARIRTTLPSTGSEGARGDSVVPQHEKIIELARLVIAATHQNDEQIQLFNNAVHYLTDSRLALAIGGDLEQARLLVADADALYRRDPKSFSAVESAFKVVQLAQRQAELQGPENRQWLSEFANQARLFAEKFPHEPNRSALALLTAGQLCDRDGLTDAARSCFALVLKQFPDSLFAEQVHGFLRRYSLIGQPLELAGPTIEGGYAAIGDHVGHPVLVVFWAAASPQFQQDCDRLLELQAELSPQGLRVLGVNLDVDEAEVDRFLEKTPLAWPQIFHSELDKRGGRHPLARYYGIQRVPTYWLVDRAGIVVAAPSGLEELASRLAELVGGS